jgi:hypothetical protein
MAPTREVVDKLKRLRKARLKKRLGEGGIPTGAANTLAAEIVSIEIKIRELE